MHRKSKTFNIFIASVFLFTLSVNAQAPAGAPSGGPGGAQSAGQMKVVIGSISFKGNKKFTEAELLKAIQIKVGDPMSPELVKKALNRMIAYYRSYGANLSVSPNIDPKDGHAVVQFIIDENGTKGDAGMAQSGGGGQQGGAPPVGGPAPAKK